MSRNHMKEGFGSRLFDAINVIVMLLLVAAVLIPLIHVVSASFSNPSDYVRHEGLLLKPLNPNLEAYKAVARNKNIASGYMNTIFIVVVGTSLSLFLTVMAAYCLSRRDLMFRDPIMMLIVFSMYFNGGMIPFYLVVKGVGLNNSIWSLIIPSAISTYNLIIMRTAMVSVPDSLEESARLDGANDWTILWRIMVPLVKPTLAVICLYYAVSNWNAWFNAMLFMQDKKDYPLQLILREILIQNDTVDMAAGADDMLLSETIQFATIVVATLPILCIYPFIQRYFVKGVMIGAVKG
ncbi:MAG: carbohydrate ABC transporter permease [Candidatus Ornithospirochaeta sp.]|nr:carbohydrate ABC transporter permease [Candidatus Ornithospirochaeta sp.]